MLSSCLLKFFQLCGSDARCVRNGENRHKTKLEATIAESVRFTQVPVVLESNSVDLYKICILSSKSSKSEMPKCLFNTVRRQRTSEVVCYGEFDRFEKLPKKGNVEFRSQASLFWNPLDLIKLHFTAEQSHCFIT